MKNPFQVRDFAEDGDKFAGEIMELQKNDLGHGFGDRASILGPGLITIGEGFAETGFRDWFIGAVWSGFAEGTMLPYQRCPTSSRLLFDSCSGSYIGC